MYSIVPLPVAVSVYFANFCNRDRKSKSMASKGKIAGKLGKNVKKAGANKQEYAPYLKVIIPAGSAVAAPPLGPQLAQVNRILKLFKGQIVMP